MIKTASKPEPNRTESGFALYRRNHDFGFSWDFDRKKLVRTGSNAFSTGSWNRFDDFQKPRFNRRQPVFYF